MNITRLQISDGDRIELPHGWIFLSARFRGGFIRVDNSKPVFEVDVAIISNTASSTYEFRHIKPGGDVLSPGVWSIPHKVEHGHYLTCKMEV